MKKSFFAALALVTLTGLAIASTGCTTKAETAYEPEQPAVKVTQTSNLTNPSVATAPEPAELTKIAFKAENHNFGEVKVGEKLSHKFFFTNTGDSPLIVKSVKPSCQCTATDYSKGEIAPGKTGYVVAEYSPKAPGVFKKTVTVVTNTEPVNKILMISGEGIK